MKEKGLSNEWEGERKRLAEMECPQCRHRFLLRWNDYSYGDRPQNLAIRGCPSGGTYMVSIDCPNCDYQEEL